jgi:hypothetical protein
MAIKIPEGQPTWRFMRYVRSPTKNDDRHRPLFPLQPATRPLRLGIDVATLPEPPAGLFTTFIRRDEIELHLLLPVGSELPVGWSTLAMNPVAHEIGYTNIDAAQRFFDTVEFPVTTKTETSTSWRRANFSPTYQQLDEQASSELGSRVTLVDRHRAAAFAAAAASLRLDAIVTNAPTAERSDVADNDIVASVTPDRAVALIGHYLRVSSNPTISIESGDLSGGVGTWKRTTSAGTIKNLYEQGLSTRLTMFDCFMMAAMAQNNKETLTDLSSIRVRIARSAQALDTLLAALSNPLRDRTEDVVDTVAEAFDRQLLYLAAAFDIYGRRFLLLIDPSRDPKKFRLSLDAGGFVDDHLKKEYNSESLSEVRRLHVYSTICKELRNHIHDGLLPIDQHSGRVYGSTRSIALSLDSIPKLLPGAPKSRLEQEHFDALGVWRTQPRGLESTPETVADLATTAVSLLSAGVSLVDEFSRLILLNKPEAAAAPSLLLGCAIDDRSVHNPPVFATEDLHRAMFDWPRI